MTKPFNSRVSWRTLLLSTGIALGACSSLQNDENLYLALGGEKAIAVIVENFILEIAGDARIIDHFEVSNVQRFRVMMNQHLCMVADGPCEYTGDSMIDTHAGMGVTEGDFNAIVENMMAAMNKVVIIEALVACMLVRRLLPWKRH